MEVIPKICLWLYPQVTSDTASHASSAVNLQRFESHARRFFWTVEILSVAILASLAIIVFGERNLFSSQLIYQTEPFVAIGQWGPVIGIVLGILGPLYLFLTPQEQTKSLQGNSGAIPSPRSRIPRESIVTTSVREVFPQVIGSAGRGDNLVVPRRCSL